MRVNGGTDLQARVMGGDDVGETGTATSTSATSLTNTGASFPTSGDGYTGHVVVAGSSPLVYGVISSNTGTVLTIDKWYTAASPGGAAASTPAGTSTYIILPGGQPAFWMALTADATAPAAPDTTLTSEISTNGLGRAVCTYAHTAAATTYTLTKAFSCTGGSTTINKAAIFNASAAGVMLFETAVPSPPTVINGDTLTVTSTVTL